MPPLIGHAQAKNDGEETKGIIVGLAEHGRGFMSVVPVAHY